VVLCDRFTDATFAYQGSGRGFDWAVLRQLESWVQALPTGLASPSDKALRQPDVTVWFELDPAIAAERLAGARVPDRFESQPVAFFQKVSDGYAQRAEDDPQRFVRLNAAQTRDAVWKQLVQHFEQRGWLLAGSADASKDNVAASTLANPSGTSA
jgi:dTMP kinase